MPARPVAVRGRRLGALAVLLVALGGCAGRDFTRPPADTLALGKTTAAQIRQRFGEPSRQGTVVRNGETMKSLSYRYASGAGSLAVLARPALPKTDSTSGKLLRMRSWVCSARAAWVTDIPGRLEGM